MKRGKTTEQKIADYIIKNGIKRTWVASNIGVSNSHLTNMLANRDTLTEKHKKAINKLLNTNF